MCLHEYVPLLAINITAKIHFEAKIPPSFISTAEKRNAFYFMMSKPSQNC